MGVVSLRKSGLIMEEDFTSGMLTTDWEVNPNDPTRWSLTEVADTLRLKHGDSPIFITYRPLTAIKRFVLDVHNEYKPLTEGDLGGIVVYADQDDAIYLEEYFDAVNGTTETYPWVRLVRDYNKYYGYWSNDGVNWHLIGSNYFDRLAPKIGVFLEGEVGESLDIKYVRALASTSVVVENLFPGSMVRLLDSNAVEVDRQVCRVGEAKVSFDLSRYPIPFQGSFSISLDGEEWIEDNLTYTIWGGDEYSFEIAPDLYVVNTTTNEELLLQPEKEGFLGYLTTESPYTKDTKVVMRTRMPGVFEDITITLREYNGKDHYQRLVELAPDDHGAPGSFSDSLYVPKLEGDDEYVFWIRTHRENDPTKYTTELYFGFQVSSRYVY